MPCVLFAHTQLRDLYFDFVLLRDNYVFCIVQNAYLYFVCLSQRQLCIFYCCALISGYSDSSVYFVLSNTGEKYVL